MAMAVRIEHQHGGEDSRPAQRRRRRRRRRQRMNPCLLWRPVLLVVVVIIVFVIAVTGAAKGGPSQKDDLYQLLGISNRQASIQEIKSAYRRKARDTHPDKNKDVSPEVAAEEFRKVVHAFEILSDESSRRHYDRTGRAGTSSTSTGGGNNYARRQQQQQHGQWTFTFRTGHGFTRKFTDRPDVKEAQSRVMHIVSMAQLETVMLDDDGLILEKNLLMVFVTPGDVEQIVDENIAFPYPFAAMSRQGIWWEDILQTVKVRYHRQGNDLTRHFGIPSGDDMRRDKTPIFVFLKRGDALDNFTTFRTTKRSDFETWVWQMLQVHVEFQNHHEHAAELYWIDGKSAKIAATIEPGESFFQFTMLSHEWWCRDARVEKFPNAPRRHKLTNNTALGHWKILSDTENVYVIQNKPCIDLSGECKHWERRNECQRNPGFMSQYCRLTCNACPSQDEESTNGSASTTEGVRDEL